MAYECNQEALGKGGSCRCVRWRSVRFSLLFLLTVGAIVGVYQARSDPEELAKTTRDNLAAYNRGAKPLTNSTLHGSFRPTAVFDINDVITHDRWVVLQLLVSENEDAEFREALACAVVEASVEQGWRPLLLAEHAACCSKPRCVLLHAGKRARLPYDLRPLLERLDNQSSTSAQRNLAFLFAIQHGARFLLDWYLEEPRQAQLSSAEYQRRTSKLLQSVTLDVSLGLVLERASDAPLFAVSPRPVRRVYNPHAHFGRPDLWSRGFKPPQSRIDVRSSHGRLFPRWVTDTAKTRSLSIRRSSSSMDANPKQRYRVCELRPPSIEKFLHHEDELDASAPAIVIPCDTLAPASAQTTLFSGEALWALALVPSSTSKIPKHLTRTMWAYPILANIAASVKVSLSPLPIPRHESLSDVTRSEEASSELSAAVLRWRCSSRSILNCVTQVGRDLGTYLGPEAASFLATWANDLRRLRYLEPPVVPLRRGGLRSPCLSHHGLGGVSFQAAPSVSPLPVTPEEVDRRTRLRSRYTEELELLDWIRQLDTSHNNNTENIEKSVANSTDFVMDLPVIKTFIPSSHSQVRREAEQSSIQRETVDGMCLGFSDLLPIRPSQDFSSLLLVVSFSSEGGYDLLPMIEVMYRPHFRNILYCGPPHPSLDIYTHKFRVAENRTLSFIPATASGFECLVGAMEMGYHVDDYLLVHSDSLILPWTISNIDRKSLWYGSYSQNDETIMKTKWRDIDPGGQKLPRVVEALGSALKFVAHLVGVHESDHDEHDLEDEMMPDEESHSPENKPLNKPSSVHPTNEDVPEVIPELHLHAEGITPNNSTLYTLDTSEVNLEPNNNDTSSGGHILLITKLIESTENLPKPNSSKDEHVESTNSPVVETRDSSDFTSIGLFSKEEDLELVSLPSNDQANHSDVLSLPNVPFEESVEFKVQKDGDTLAHHSKDVYFTNRTVDPKDQNQTTVMSPLESEVKGTKVVVGQPKDQTEETTRITDGVIQYILSAITEANTNSSSTVSPSDIPWLFSNETLDKEENNTSNQKDEEEVNKGNQHSSIHLSSNFDSDGDSGGLIVLEEGMLSEKHLPTYHVESEDKEKYNVPSFLDIDELTDSSLNPVHDSLSSNIEEEITKSLENGYSKRKAEEVEEMKGLVKRDTTSTRDNLMDRRMERSLQYIEELFLNVVSRVNTSQETHMLSSQSNRLDPREFKHLRCLDTSMPFYHSSTDLCHTLRSFILQISELYHQENGDFTPPYTSFPIYHVPASQQRAFYLLANVFLQFGVPDQVAVPLLLRGLAQPGKLVHLHRSFFGSNTPTTVQPGYPLFDEKAHFLFPLSLQQDLHGDSKFRTVFCLKYLYNMLS